MSIHYCPHCGAKLEEGMKFCPKCGEKIPSADDQEAVSSNEVLDRQPIVSKKDIEKINRKLTIENNQDSIVKKSLILAGIFALLMIMPFMDWSPLAGLWALTMISLFLMIASLIVAWMFRGRSQKLQTLISGENLLSSWTLTSVQKEKYIDHLFKEQIGKNIIVLSSIAVITVIVFGVFILFIDEGKLTMLGVMVGLIFFLALFAFGMPFYYRYSNRKGDGQVLLGSKYAYINGYFHNWDYPLSGLSKIKVIKEPFYGIDLTYFYTDRTLQHQEEILIPANEELDLKPLVQAMKKQNTEKM